MQSRYDALWQSAAPEVRAGRAALDPLVLRKDDDPRRGLTLLLRPAPDVAARIDAVLGALREIEPGQHYQPRADLHVTVLSLFTATADWAPWMARVDTFREIVAEAVAGMPPFVVASRGVTLATGAVLAQGFPADDTLERIRTRLRDAAARRGLGEVLDQRYRLETVHSTLVRFASPLVDPARFVDALARLRDADFGATTVSTLELVLGDWYQSHDRELAVDAYTLSDADR